MFKLFSTGFIIGLAQLIPGFSGGTMAVAMNTYGDLIRYLRNPFHRDALRYLIVIGLGVISGIGLNASLIKMLLQAYPAFLYSVFTVLLISSIRVAFQALDTPKYYATKMAMASGIGLVLGLILTQLSPISPRTSMDFFTWVLTGTIGSITMIVPGISGSMLLLILGLYHPVLDAITLYNWSALLGLGLGLGLGFALSVRVIHWILIRHKPIAIGIIIGLISLSIPILVQIII